MKNLCTLIVLLMCSTSAKSMDCSLVYDEFDSLMNKAFLLTPEKFVAIEDSRLSRADFLARQKGQFLLNKKRADAGIAIVTTNQNRRAKVLYTWDNKRLLLNEVVVYDRVMDGNNPRRWRNIKVKSSFAVDLDSGTKDQEHADLWFHNIDGDTMYIEGINGASIKFPMTSLCNKKNPTLAVAAHAAAIRRPDRLARQPLAVDQPPVTSAGQECAGTTPADSLEKAEVARQLLPNGHVLITYSDGSTLETFEGGMVRTTPDGTQLVSQFSTAAPAAIPVQPPDTDEQQWLNGHRGRLRDILRTLVNDDALVDEALENFDSDDNVYRSIEQRSALINRLVTP